MGGFVINIKNMRSFVLFFAASVLVAACQATVSQCYTGSSNDGTTWASGPAVLTCTAPNNKACAILKRGTTYWAMCSPVVGGSSGAGCQSTSGGVTSVGKTSTSDAWNGKTAAEVKTEVDAIPSPAPPCPSSPAAVGSVPSFLLAIVAIFGVISLQLV